MCLYCFRWQSRSHFKGKESISDTKEKLLNSVGVELFSVIIALKALRKISKDADKVSVTIMTDYRELERFHHLLNTQLVLFKSLSSV